MSSDELIGKYRENVGGVVPDDKAKQVVDAVLSLEKSADASALIQLMVPA
jgi:hypothetical protein